METDRLATLKKIASIVAGVLVIAGIVAIFALPRPQQRHYPKRIQVRFWHMWTAEWARKVSDICDEFNKSQDKYEVIPLSVPSGAADSKFLLAVAGGDPPDVMAQWNPVIPYWADSKLLQPLDQMMTPKQWKEFQDTAYPAAKKIGIYKGRLYGVTTGTNVWAVFYLPKHVRAAGLDPNKFPGTLEGLMEWGKKLNKFDKNGNLVRIGFLPSWLMEFAPIFGGRFYDPKTGELTLYTRENLRALEFLVDERNKIGYAKVVRFESGLRNASSGQGDWPFMGGFYSMTIDGVWRVEELRKYNAGVRRDNAELRRNHGDPRNLKSEVEYGTAPVPPPTGGTKNAGYADGNFLIIPRGAKHVEGAWEFIKFWSGIENPRRAAEFYTWGGWLPLNTAVANAPAYKEYIRKNPQFKTFLDLVSSKDLLTCPPVPYQAFLIDQINRADDFATRGSLTPRQALETLEKDIVNERARRKELGYND